MTQGLDWLEQASRGKFSTEQAPATPAAAVGTGFYARMQKTANNLLIGKGQAVTITHVVQGTYSPATGRVTNSTTTQTGTGAVVDWDARLIDGTLIKQGDRRLLLSPLNSAGAVLTAPVLGDKVKDAAGVVYTMVAPMNILSPAGTIVIYDCNMRV